VTVIDTVQASVHDAASEPSEKDDGSRTWLPAAEIFGPSHPAALGLYKSSPGRSRWFCRHCGTSLAYSIDAGVIPEEWGWPTMLDIWLGTVDRRDIEKDYMAPERMLWCEKGVPWIRRQATKGAGGIPEHPLTMIDVLVAEQKH